ncbi:hypothetical protein AVEN_132766-1 [Araneus ventricosus]|uniref:Uncharacterized protein n=1 Tax=Araneus ventricosus TaxID=182803 RepID=A0A4Y2W567_ARAVE|nr:hypothetical protein AVEN_136142-1 [Araneus ventricosus]GBO32004.1 hypothetical protein AVEN_198729-1 [Araneus ventricosus]GBO32067.1 hypothetical protein AVEN_224237-1 [Araneus ventricosus]GBO32077.1 hypothetical protein AVEN_132766-1 [Araneus ventricosus]
MRPTRTVVRKLWVATPKGVVGNFLSVAKFKEIYLTIKNIRLFFKNCGCEQQSSLHRGYRPPEGSRLRLSDLQRGRVQGYQTSRGVATTVIRPSETSRLRLSDLQRGHDLGYQTSREVATKVIRPPEGSRLRLSNFQRGHD